MPVRAGRSSPTSGAVPGLVLFDVYATGQEAHQRFVDLVAQVRPELFRYCSRMTGSVFNGEDIVQETLAKAFEALPRLAEPPVLRPWLFRIAYNAAMDFLKRYERKHVDFVADVPETATADEGGVDPALVEAALARFIELPALQRSALVLKDVLGHSLVETAATMGTTVSAVKSALVRARTSLASDAGSRETPPREVSAAQRENLRRYAEHFNNRDWDALRGLLGEESRLDLVSRTQRRGAGVAEYYSRYADRAPRENLRAEVGWVDDVALIAMFRPASSATPSYFVLLEWDGQQVSRIRDFRHVPYIAEGARYNPA
jgi:RNA polymerase sigma-70 factor, ECF subfamily